MTWALVWGGSAVAGAAFGWFVGPVPLDLAVQVIVALAQIAGDDA